MGKVVLSKAEMFDLFHWELTETCLIKVQGLQKNLNFQFV